MTINIIYKFENSTIFFIRNLQKDKFVAIQYSNVSHRVRWKIEKVAINRHRELLRLRNLCSWSKLCVQTELFANCLWWRPSIHLLKLWSWATQAIKSVRWWMSFRLALYLDKRWLSKKKMCEFEIISATRWALRALTIMANWRWPVEVLSNAVANEFSDHWKSICRGVIFDAGSDSL